MSFDLVSRNTFYLYRRSLIGTVRRYQELRRPKLSKYERRVVSLCDILTMAVNIKDLYGNSGKRFKNINTR